MHSQHTLHFKRPVFLERVPAMDMLLWLKEDWVTSTPDWTDKRLSFDNSCPNCAGQMKLVISKKNYDHINQSDNGKDVHYVHCLSCLTRTSGALPYLLNESDVSDFVMPFGKHKGKALSEIPRDYLLWASANLNKNVQKKINLFLGIATDE